MAKGIIFSSQPYSEEKLNNLKLPLFLTKAHRFLQVRDQWTGFYATTRKEKIVVAAIFFQIDKQVATSPVKAPFGGFATDPDLDAETIHLFIKFIEDELRKKKVHEIRIKCMPQFYSSSQVIIETLLINHGFSVVQAEATVFLKTKKTFNIDLHSWEKRRLNQSIKAGLVWKNEPLSAFKKVYQFIYQCRTERNQSLSMSYLELRKTVRTFPDSFFLFTVYNQSHLIAASISIRVTDRILYNFYSAHAKSSDRLSPVVFLLEGMSTWCRSKKIDFIDLGTSSIKGQINFSLFDFKIRLGGIVSPKLQFQKSL